MNVPTIRYPAPPALVAVYVEIMGPKLAMEFLLAFGGAPLEHHERTTARSRIAAVVGPEHARALAQENHRLQPRVPLATRWLAACLKAEGQSVHDIARKLRCSDVTVRKYLRAQEAAEARRRS